jgi:hypothetical protein
MKKILILGCNEALASTQLMLSKIKEEFGKDVQFYTPEQAQAEGLKENDFANIPVFEIKNYRLNDLNEATIVEPEFFNSDFNGTGKGARARNRSSFKNKFGKLKK